MVDFSSVFGTSVAEAVNNSVTSDKPLIVYITDDSESQNVWIDALLTEELLSVIAEKAISLKLIKNTSECQMFEQIFPNVIVPSIFCIKVSAVLDVIHGDVDREAFESRIKQVLDSKPSNSPEAVAQPQLQSQVAPSPQPQQPQQPQTTPSIISTTTPASRISSSSPRPTPPALSPSPTFASSPRSSGSSTLAKPKTLKEQVAEMTINKYKEEQLRKKKVERDEMERVKRLLKADQEERKLKVKRKTEERERQRRLSNDEEIDDVSRIDEIIHEQQTLRDNIRARLPSNTSDLCVLAIKLLNGSSLRQSFSVNDTLNDVREWVDQNRTDGSDPYSFHRTIPRVTFDITDEQKSLEALELAPRSALILKPFNNFSNAYSNTGSTNNVNHGLFSRILGGLSSFWSGGNAQPVGLAGEDGPLSAVSERDDILVDIQSGSSSQYASPAHSPAPGAHALDLSHPSALSLNLNLQEQPDLAPPRPVTPQSIPAESPIQNIARSASSQITPRIRTFNSLNDDRTTYNGNHTNLEDDSKK